MVKQLETQEEFETFVQENDVVVIDFFATWCGPCKKITPVVQQLADKYTDMKFVKVDAEEVEEAAQQYEVNGLPHFVFMKGGEKVGEYIGSSEKVLGEKITAFRQQIGFSVDGGDDKENDTATNTTAAAADKTITDDMFSNDDF